MCRTNTGKTAALNIAPRLPTIDVDARARNPACFRRADERYDVRDLLRRAEAPHRDVLLDEMRHALRISLEPSAPRSPRERHRPGSDRVDADVVLRERQRRRLRV